MNFLQLLAPDKDKIESCTISFGSLKFLHKKITKTEVSVQTRQNPLSRKGWGLGTRLHHIRINDRNAPTLAHLTHCLEVRRHGEGMIPAVR